MTAEEKRAKMRHAAMPDGLERMDTGPVQFGQDWPGFFIRGDEAMGLAYLRDYLESIFERHPEIRFSEQLQILSDIRCLGRVRECLMIDDRPNS